MSLPWPYLAAIIDLRSLMKHSKTCEVSPSKVYNGVELLGSHLHGRIPSSVLLYGPHQPRSIPWYASQRTNRVSELCPLHNPAKEKSEIFPVYFPPYVILAAKLACSQNFGWIIQSIRILTVSSKSWLTLMTIFQQQPGKIHFSVCRLFGLYCQNIWISGIDAHPPKTWSILIRYDQHRSSTLAEVRRAGRDRKAHTQGRI